MRIIALSCALVLAGCQSGPIGEQDGLAVQTQDAVSLAHLQQRVDDDYIAPFIAGDTSRWIEIFDSDVVGLHNRLPAMEGKDALQGFGQFVSQNLVVSQMSVELQGVRQEGDVAYTWGTYHSQLLMRESGELMQGHNPRGKVLFVWKRQTDGSWKIAVDMGNELPSGETP
jgi:ketosteroid isomerase-like protein